MITYGHALQLMNQECGAGRLSSEKIDLRTAPLESVLGRVLSEDVVSSESLPEFDNSAVDGFAVRSSDLTETTMTLPVGFLALPGEVPRSFRSDMQPRIAIEIMTGAPLPAGGFDRLIKVEDVLKRSTVEGRTVIVFEVEKASPHHVRQKGSDYRAGDPVASAGKRVDSDTVMALAALGIYEIRVFRRPKVWILSTGNELIDAFMEAKPPGKVRNATGPYLAAELSRLGCEVRGPLPVPDLTFGETLTAALKEGADLILTTGAVSMGIHDFVRQAVLDHGGRVGFHHVAIRPGKPILFAMMPAGTPLLGLPGNPISTAIGLRFFVEPLLRGWWKQSVASHRAMLKHEIEKPRNLRTFFKARCVLDADSRLGVEILSGQASFMIHPMKEANAWAILPEGVERLPAGAPIEVRFFPEKPPLLASEQET